MVKKNILHSTPFQCYVLLWFRYLLSVLVHDVQTGVVTRFVANQWLAIDRGTYEDDITIHASAEDDILDSAYRLRSSGGNSLSDDHLYWSVFSRPLHSRYIFSPNFT